MCPAVFEPLLSCPLPYPGFGCTPLRLPCSRDTKCGKEVVCLLQHPFPILPPKQEEERMPLRLGTGVGVLRGQHMLQWVWVQRPHIPPALIHTPLTMNTCSFASSGLVLSSAAPRRGSLAVHRCIPAPLFPTATSA